MWCHLSVARATKGRQTHVTQHSKAVRSHDAALKPSNTNEATTTHMLVITMYKTLVPSVKDLIARKSVRIRDMPGFFQNVRNSMQPCCQAGQTTSGRNLEHLL
ncbi:hypothetical protein TNCV_500771 [Trichonephila clavipes]|nr:hypothetical protein TNCV_500771 [Trichonephila clavipes]